MAAKKRRDPQKKRLDTLAATTKEQKESLLECLSTMPTTESACRKANVGRATYYDWIKRDSAFASEAAKARKKGRELLSDVAVSKLMQLVGDGNITAIIFWLKHNHEWFANPKFFHYIEIKEDPGIDDETKKLIHTTIGRYVKKVARDEAEGRSGQSWTPRTSKAKPKENTTSESP